MAVLRGQVLNLRRALEERKTPEQLVHMPTGRALFGKILCELLPSILHSQLIPPFCPCLLSAARVYLKRTRAANKPTGYRQVFQKRMPFFTWL